VNFVKEFKTNSRPFGTSDTLKTKTDTNNVVGGMGSSLSRNGVQTGQLEEKPRICSTLKTQLAAPTVLEFPYLAMCSSNRIDWRMWAKEALSFPTFGESTTRRTLLGGYNMALG